MRRACECLFFFFIFFFFRCRLNWAVGEEWESEEEGGGGGGCLMRRSMGGWVEMGYTEGGKEGEERQNRSRSNLRKSSDRLDDVNKNCAKYFRLHWGCLDNNNQQLWHCRRFEQSLNACVFDKLVKALFSSPSPSLSPFGLPIRLYCYHHYL